MHLVVSPLPRCFKTACSVKGTMAFSLANKENVRRFLPPVGGQFVKNWNKAFLTKACSSGFVCLVAWFMGLGFSEPFWEKSARFLLLFCCLFRCNCKAFR